MKEKNVEQIWKILMLLPQVGMIIIWKTRNCWIEIVELVKQLEKLIWKHFSLPEMNAQKNRIIMDFDSKPIKLVTHNAFVHYYNNIFQNHEILKDLLDVTWATPIKEHYWMSLLLNFFGYLLSTESLCVCAREPLLMLKSFFTWLFIHVCELYRFSFLYSYTFEMKSTSVVDFFFWTWPTQFFFSGDDFAFLFSWLTEHIVF